MVSRNLGLVAAAILAASFSPASAQTITEFPVPSSPGYITAGSDGNLWFGASGDKIVRMTTSGNLTEFPLPPHFDLHVYGLTSGPDGNVWYVRSRSFIDFEPDFGRVGRVTPAGGVTEFSFDDTLSGITIGPDANLWFTGSGRSNIYRMTTAGQLLLPTFQVPGPGRFLVDVATGPDGNVWFVENALNRIGRITTSGIITEFPIPTPSSLSFRITAGADGNLWFLETSANKIGRITTSGAITEFPVPTPQAGLLDITTGPDGNVWFTELSANRIGRITPAGVITEFPVPTPSSGPFGITVGPDSALWFTESSANKIGRITTGIVEDPTQVLPVVGSTVGVGGSFFRTSVQLHNAGTTPSVGGIVFHPSGTPGSAQDTVLPFSLASGETQTIPDLLPAMGLSGLGSADVILTLGSAGNIPVVSARVFNDAGAAGTTGFALNAVPADEALRAGRRGVLLIPSDLVNFRLNVGLRTLLSDAALTLTVRNAAGAVAAVVPKFFPAVYHEQQTATAFLNGLAIPPGGSITVLVESGSAIVYGATVDNRTGDPSLQIARPSP